MQKLRANFPQDGACGTAQAFSTPENSSWIGRRHISRCTQPLFCCDCKTFTEMQEINMPKLQRTWRNESVAPLKFKAPLGMNFFSRPRAGKVSGNLNEGVWHWMNSMLVAPFEFCRSACATPVFCRAATLRLIAAPLRWAFWCRSAALGFLVSLRCARLLLSLRCAARGPPPQYAKTARLGDPGPAAQGRMRFLPFPAFSLRSVWDKSQ